MSEVNENSASHEQRLEQAKIDLAARAIGWTPPERPADYIEMVTADDSGLSGQKLADYWDNIGLGLGGFYDDIREHGCAFCGSHTPGCCDGCA